MSKNPAIYLGDLGHFTLLLTNNVVPLNIAYLASFLKLHLGEEIQVYLFKNPDTIIAAIKNAPPDFLALSNYVWNQSVSDKVLRIYKQFKPEGVTVMGGPNFPINEPKKEVAFLRDRPYLDFYVPYEGELPILNIITNVLNNNCSLKGLDRNRVEGCCFLSEDGRLIENNITLKIADVNSIPSPYLTGYLDAFLEMGLLPMIETCRGCPFSCTFCHTGNRYYSKVRFFDLQRCKEEVRYIYRKVSGDRYTYLRIADTNFGLYDRDVEFARFLEEFSQRTGVPHAIYSSTATKRINNVLNTVLGCSKLNMGMSVQSLDSVVLKNIKRVNMPLDSLVKCQKKLEKTDKLSGPEVILGLPGETKESHIKTLRLLLNVLHPSKITQYTCMVLPGAELYADKTREQYRFTTKHRLIPTGFGEYDGEKCFEVEEVVVATKDMSFEEYLEMRSLFFIINNVYANEIYRPLMQCIQYLQRDIVDFMYFTLERAENSSEFAGRMLKSYQRDTRQELFDSKDELTAAYSTPENYQRLLSGEIGVNLAHTYRTSILMNSVAWSGLVTECFREFVGGRRDATNIITESVIRHVKAMAECQFRLINLKGSIPTRNSPLEVLLDCDVPGWLAAIQELSSTVVAEPDPGRVTYCYYMSEDAVKFVNSLGKKVTALQLARDLIRSDPRILFPLVFKKYENEP